ncbi:hypothetical protein Noda2021_06250 [Candidatus Dependentiae bacterium Noda2021]|nr:hypothetical protein Noda2021_06250 [Candidatus Dependentiae bacterium Noda2021]
MKKILIMIMSCISLLTRTQEPNSHVHPLVRGLEPHQLVDSYPNRSIGIPEQISNQIDQGIWGELERKYPCREVSTEQEFYLLVQSYLTLKNQCENNQVCLASIQNQVTELETITPVPLSSRILKSLEKMLASACTLAATISVSKLENTREMLPIKTSATTLGLGISAYFFTKAIGSLQQNDLKKLPDLRRQLQLLQNSVTTSKLYLNQFDKTLKQHTRFHQTHPTPTTLGEFTGMFGSTPLPDDAH